MVTLLDGAYIAENEPGAGNCFMWAMVMANELITTVAKSDRVIKVCHGKPIYRGRDGRTPEGSRYWHAWVEWQDASCVFCQDSQGKPNIVPMLWYYQEGGIVPAEVRRYGYEEAVKLIEDQGHYGPWFEGAQA